jgi:hypothetical protein
MAGAELELATAECQNTYVQPGSEAQLQPAASPGKEGEEGSGVAATADEPKEAMHRAIRRSGRGQAAWTSGQATSPTQRPPVPRRQRGKRRSKQKAAVLPWSDAEDPIGQDCP